MTPLQFFGAIFIALFAFAALVWWRTRGRSAFYPTAAGNDVPGQLSLEDEVVDGLFGSVPAPRK